MAIYQRVSDDTERQCALTIQAMLRCFAHCRTTSDDRDTVGSEEGHPARQKAQRLDEPLWREIAHGHVRSKMNV